MSDERAPEPLPHGEWEKPWKTDWPGRATAPKGRPSPDQKQAQARRNQTLVDRARQAREADPRPNVLFIFTDQQTLRAMSCMGNPHVNTPNMDRLALRGVRFSQSYCTAPVCGPSRSSLVTSRMPHETGVTFNNHSPDPAIPNMGHIFRQGGYETVWCGKWHLPESYVYDYDGIPGFDNIPHTRDQRSMYGLGDQVDFLHTMDAVFFLKWESYKIGLPWLLSVSLHNPHDICHWTSIPPRVHHNLDRYPPLPPNFEVPPDEVDFLQRGRTNPKYGEMPRTLDWGEGQWRAYIEAYYHMTEQVDRAIGLILNALEESGWLDNTLVIFTSDHGDGCGAHRWPAKLTLYEEPMTVPLIVSFPGRVPENRLDETHLVSGLDILPTMCDYAGIAGPAEMRGRSLRPILDDPSAPWRDYLVSEVATGSRDEPHYGRMVRTGPYKYNAYSVGRRNEQLFDLDSDPGEMRNRIDDPSLRPAVEDCRNKLREWQLLTDDPYPLG